MSKTVIRNMRTSNNKNKSKQNMSKNRSKNSVKCKKTKAKLIKCYESKCDNGYKTLHF